LRAALLNAIVIAAFAAVPPHPSSRKARRYRRENGIEPDIHDGKIRIKLAVTNKFGVTQNEFHDLFAKGGDVLIAITSGPDKGQKVLRLKQSVYLYYPTRRKSSG
jgi:hypothetical protein